MGGDKTTPKQRGVLGGVTGKGFLPGQSGNPLGRPRKATFAEMAREVLAEEDPRKRKIKWRLLVEKTASLALRDSARHLEILLYRAEGRVKQVNEISGQHGMALQFQNLTDGELDARLEELRAKYEATKKKA